MRRQKTTAERFWEKVTRGPKDECWAWIGAVDPRGRGRFTIGSQSQNNKKVIFASRMSYELATGETAGELVVCHSCDNPNCVNPNHLFLGTQYDNIKDMFSKGRQRTIRGHEHYRANLTDADVLAIRNAVGASHRELAKRYGISSSSVTRIRNRQQWAHVAAQGESHG
jgi:hypothetical protein